MVQQPVHIYIGTLKINIYYISVSATLQRNFAVFMEITSNLPEFNSIAKIKHPLLDQNDQFYSSETLPVNRMRKRSGGIHCQNQQEFFQLSQKSFQVTGLFYADKYNRSAYLEPQDPSTKNKRSVFIGFDYEIDNEQDEDHRNDSKEVLQSINVVSVIICQNIQKLRQALGQNLYTENEHEEREIDLLTRIQEFSKNKKFIFKYWLIKQSMLASTIAQIYISAAKNIYWTINSQCPLKSKISLCKFKQIHQKIVDKQKLIMKL